MQATGGNDRVAYTQREVAQMIGCCERSIGNFARRNGLRAVKVGRRTLIRADDLKAWLDSRPVVASPTEAERESETTAPR